MIYIYISINYFTLHVHNPSLFHSNLTQSSPSSFQFPTEAQDIMICVRFSLNCKYRPVYLSTTKPFQSPLLLDKISGILFIVQFAEPSSTEFLQNSLGTQLIAVTGSFLGRVTNHITPLNDLSTLTLPVQFLSVPLYHLGT